MSTQFGGQGVRTGAKIAIRMMIASMITPTMARRKRRKRRTAARRGETRSPRTCGAPRETGSRAASASAIVWSASGSLRPVIRHSWIGDGIGDVGEDVRHQDGDAGDEDDPHHQRWVACVGRLDGQLPHPVPGEYLFGDD